MSTTKESLIKSIESIASESFHTCSGAPAIEIYLDPVEKQIYCFQDSSATVVAWREGVDKKILILGRDSIPESIADYLLARVTDLVKILEERWNGSSWSEWPQEEYSSEYWSLFGHQEFVAKRVPTAETAGH